MSVGDISDGLSKASRSRLWQLENTLYVMVITCHQPCAREANNTQTNPTDRSPQRPARRHKGRALLFLDASC